MDDVDRLAAWPARAGGENGEDKRSRKHFHQQAAVARAAKQVLAPGDGARRRPAQIASTGIPSRVVDGVLRQRGCITFGGARVVTDERIELDLPPPDWQEAMRYCATSRDLPRRQDRRMPGTLCASFVGRADAWPLRRLDLDAVQRGYVA